MQNLEENDVIDIVRKAVMILFLLIGTGFLLTFGGWERKKQEKRNEAAEKFIKTAVLFQSTDYEGLSDCYPDEIGEDFIFDLKETYHCLDTVTKEILPKVTFEVAESRELNEEELEKQRDIPEGAGLVSGGCWVKVELFIPGEEMEQILECMVLEYDGHCGVWGIRSDDMEFYLWEDREKILLKYADYDEEGQRWSWTEYRYDDRGNLKIEVDYLYQDKILSWRTYDYDASGELTGEVYYWYENSGNLKKEEIRYKYRKEYSYPYDGCENTVRKIRYEYRSEYENVRDDHGRQYWEMEDGGLWEKTVYNENEEEIRWFRYGDGEDVKIECTYEYDEEGNKTAEIRDTYYDNGSIKLSEKYDEAGRLVSETEYDAEGGGNSWRRYEYDQTGNITADIRRGQDGDWKKYEYQYDNVGNLRREIFYNGEQKEGVSKRYGYTYDTTYDDEGKGRTIAGFDEKGKLIYKGEYDERGYLIREIGYDSAGKILHEYEYDKEGNLTLEIHRDRKYGDYLEEEYSAFEYDEKGGLTRKFVYNPAKTGDIFEYEYDAWGNVLRYNVYSENGRIINCNEYSRMMREWYIMIQKWTGVYPADTWEKVEESVEEWTNQQGSFLAENGRGKEISYFRDGTICGWSEYEFDDMGNIVWVDHYFRDGRKLEREKWEYDDERKLIRKIFYNERGEVKRWNEREYDSGKKLVRENRFDGDGNSDGWSEYEYEEENLTREVIYDGEGEWMTRNEYEYNENGRLLQKVLYNNTTRYRYEKRWVYKYDENERLICEFSYYNVELDERREYKYDAEGKMIVMALYGTDGSERLHCWYKYAYDDDGNRVGETIYHADGSIYIHTEYIGVKAK